VGEFGERQQASQEEPVGHRKHPLNRHPAIIGLQDDVPPSSAALGTTSRAESDGSIPMITGMQFSLP
jgi:hypothetical protein